jgi:hypothetical protein
MNPLANSAADMMEIQRQIKQPKKAVMLRPKPAGVPWKSARPALIAGQSGKSVRFK